VEKNTSGARPKELFEDALEVADAQFEKDKVKLKDAVKDRDISVGVDTTFENFNAALEDVEEVKGIIRPNR
jgi:pre-mRNA-processing factor 40